MARKHKNKISSPLRISPSTRTKVALARDVRQAKLTTWSRISRATNLVSVDFVRE